MKARVIVKPDGKPVVEVEAENEGEEMMLQLMSKSDSFGVTLVVDKKVKEQQ